MRATFCIKSISFVFLETYDEAIAKLELLKRQHYVYSTDSDTGAKQRALRDLQEYQLKAVIPANPKELLQAFALDLDKEIPSPNTKTRD